MWTSNPRILGYYESDDVESSQQELERKTFFSHNHMIKSISCGLTCIVVVFKTQEQGQVKIPGIIYCSCLKVLIILNYFTLS